MSIEPTTQAEPVAPQGYEWENPEPPTDLIFDDGEPLESNRHRIAIDVLIDSTHQALKDRSDFFAGGNMFVYYSRNQSMNRDFRGPDFFVVLEVDGNRERQGWVVWEEDGRYSDVIVELSSPSTANVDLIEKKHLYERTFRTSNYFVYDPFNPDSLQGWQLDASHRYQPLQPNEQGWLWCEALNLWLGTWKGSILREPPAGTCAWLRFHNTEGNLILLPGEAAQNRIEVERQRAEAEHQRAERLAARLRELGIDPEQV